MKLKWSKTRHSCSSASLPIGDLSVGWSSKSRAGFAGYEAHALGHQTEGLHGSMEAAKIAAEQLAMCLLTESIREFKDNG